MKKISLRKCLVKKVMLPKEDLLRIAKFSNGQISIDINQNLGGRGVYLSKEIDTILTAKKKHLIEKAFNINIDDSLYESLIELVERR